ncbi:MAG: TetR family transcriptional regulator C-terminal domain-containing protein [Proteobacteria bacterium]|nr:TetR family transcriptional regulator C-terminal domain-containing protein [Pseudomonadota bacterium]
MKKSIASTASKKVKQNRTREQLEQDILTAAKRLFANRGFGGVSLDHVAREVGVSKQNLLYYFPSKEELYRRVLHGVLDVWLSYMDALSQRADDPEQALREYIAGKLRFSREHPDDSRVYAKEVISGAPIFFAEIAARVIPALEADVAIFNKWAEQGLCRPVDAKHLMIVLWAVTQAYADWASQIRLVLEKPALDAQDFQAAESLIVDMVLRTVLFADAAEAAPRKRAGRVARGA